MTGQRSISSILFLLFAGIALLLMFVDSSGLSSHRLVLMGLLLAGCAAIWSLPLNRQGWLAGGFACAAVAVGAWTVLLDVHNQPGGETADKAIWVFVLALGFLAWRGMEILSAIQSRGKLTKLVLDLGIPVIFGAWLFFLWEALAVGMSIPRVLLPPPSEIGEAMSQAGPILAADFYQTFVRAVIPGFLMGSSAGFLAAIAADRVPFLKRGLLPLGNLVSAIPIVGIAPIMVMWFGFDWQSKAAVVTIMTFFPMLVNTLSGLAATSKIERDLLHTYASGYWQELYSLRLPNALPFILNALKINSTLAMIGAIVAEFFGTPIVGMGFRISTEVGRMNIDMVWATIAVAALAGSLFYGLFAVMERVFTFWHPSMRKH
jgi:NitT/TauT family transport system permease protein